MQGRANGPRQAGWAGARRQCDGADACPTESHLSHLIPLNPAKKLSSRPATQAVTTVRRAGQSPAQRAAHAPGVGGTFELARLKVLADRAHSACPVRTSRPSARRGAARGEPVARCLVDASFEGDEAGTRGVGREGIGMAVGGETRSLHRILQRHAENQAVEQELQVRLDLRVAAGVPNGMIQRPGASAKHGLGVRRGRLPGARHDGWPRIAHDWSPRDDTASPFPAPPAYPSSYPRVSSTMRSPDRR